MESSWFQQKPQWWFVFAGRKYNQNEAQGDTGIPTVIHPMAFDKQIVSQLYGMPHPIEMKTRLSFRRNSGCCFRMNERRRDCSIIGQTRPSDFGSKGARDIWQVFSGGATDSGASGDIVVQTK
jgi:hypothetical protein